MTKGIFQVAMSANDQFNRRACGYKNIWARIRGLYIYDEDVRRGSLSSVLFCAQ